MALTPTQMGTKSRSLTGPSSNIRSRPNGIGRTPMMGRVQQVSPYQLGELVETPLGLRRIKGITPFTMNVDLGPRGKLTSKALVGATTISVESFNKSVAFAIGDVLIIGGPNDPYRETVKIGAAVTISSSTVSVSLSTALKNTHPKGNLVVSQKLPPNYDGEFIEVEELRILGDDKYAYVIPSVPKQPRYISRTGTFGDDATKNQEAGTGLDPTANFKRYESIPVDILKSLAQVTSATFTDAGSPPYQLYAIGHNADGSARPILRPSGASGIGSEEVLINTVKEQPTSTETKDVMLLTGTYLEKGSAEARHLWSQLYGASTAYQAVDHFLRLNTPENFISIEFSSEPLKSIFQSMTSAEFQEITDLHFIDFLIRDVLLGPGDRGSESTGIAELPPDGLQIVLDTLHPPTEDHFLTIDDLGGAAGFDAFNSIEIPAYKNSLLSAPLGSGGFLMPEPFFLSFGYGGGFGGGSNITDHNGRQAFYLQGESSANSDALFCQLNQTQTLKITGTVSVSGTTVTGSGTSFLSELSDTTGSRKSVIYIPGSHTAQQPPHLITNIASNTSLTIGTSVSSIVNVSGKNAYITDFENIPLIRRDFKVIDARLMLKERMEFRGTSTTSNDKSGLISQRVFLQLPKGQTRWASKKALDNNKNEETGFIDAFQSPEDSPNETFAFYVGKSEESLPYMKSSNKTGETILDGRVKISGYIIDAPRVEAQELKKIQQRAGYYKAKLFPHTGFFPNLDDRLDGPTDGWEPQSRRNTRNLLQALSDLSAEVKKEIRGA